jgi:hypothetical protein
MTKVLHAPPYGGTRAAKHEMPGRQQQADDSTSPSAQVLQAQDSDGNRMLRTLLSGEGRGEACGCARLNPSACTQLVSSMMPLLLAAWRITLSTGCDTHCHDSPTVWPTSW